jgi:hypothetical protein
VIGNAEVTYGLLGAFLSLSLVVVLCRLIVVDILMVAIQNWLDKAKRT